MEGIGPIATHTPITNHLDHSPQNQSHLGDVHLRAYLPLIENHHRTQHEDEGQQDGEEYSSEGPMSPNYQEKEQERHLSLGAHQQLPKLMAAPMGNDMFVSHAPILAPMFNARNNMLLPTAMLTLDEPLYVNAKQYNRILARRQARQRLEMKYKILPRKQWLHDSRHNHAAKRERGPGGRFLSKDEKKARQLDPQLQVPKEEEPETELVVKQEEEEEI